MKDIPPSRCENSPILESMRSLGQVLLENVSYEQGQDVVKENLDNMANGGRSNSQRQQRQVSSNGTNHRSHKHLRTLPKDLGNGNGQNVTNTNHRDHSAGVLTPRTTTIGLLKTQCTSGPPNGNLKGVFMRPRDPPMVNNPGVWVFAVPAVVAGLCFAHSMLGEFVHDDVWAILNNPDSRGETNLSTVFKNDFWGKAMDDNTSHKSYRPLCVLSFR